MQLFKRVLLSLFPDEMMANNVNPASMFISFISAKEFFSIINRKIIENYKLNLFDIAIDPFEFKIGFGENKGINKKDVDLYYWYCGTANMNGYRFMNPSNIWNTLTMATGLFVYEIFEKYPDEYFINFMFSVYLLNFVFLARIKVFPDVNEADSFNRFIEVFFDFYETIFEQSGIKFDPRNINAIKKSIIAESDVFFVLYRHYQKFNWLYYNDTWYGTDEDFYRWIFHDELKNVGISDLIKNFIAKKDDFVYKPKFSLVDKKILQYILPADILLKYILIDMDINLVFSCVVSKVFDKDILHKKVKWFRTWNGNLNELYLYLTDYKNFKKWFFDWIQKYIITVFREDDKNWHSIDDEIDDMMSDIGSDPENLKDLKVPERIKKESRIMEKFLNFYLTLIWGFWIARWDSLNLLLCKKDFVNQILDSNDWWDNKANTIHYYGSLLYNYGKNVFYYKNISENVRAGKQKFFLPYKNTNKDVYSNMHIVRLFDENFVSTLLQRINDKDIKLYINNKKLLDIFKKIFGKEISALAKKDNHELVNILYWSQFNWILSDKIKTNIFLKNLDVNDIYHIKDNMYSLDFWIYEEVLAWLKEIWLKEDYSDTNIFGIISSMMDTLPGFLLYTAYLKMNKKATKYEILYDIYCIDVLNISKDYCKSLKKMIKWIEDKFMDLLNLWIELDDNEAFFQIALNNWKEFIKWRTDIYKSVSGEDVLWFKWFLKNITYYNKRYLIPK